MEPQTSRPGLRAPLDGHGLLRGLALALCVFFAVHGVHAGLRPIGSDFTVFYRAGEELLAGRDPERVARFLYLPAFALAIAPLALLPYTLALVLWQFASLAALVWLTQRCARWCAHPSGEPRPWLDWLPLVVCLRLVDSNLANGQANLLVLALVVAGGEAWLRARDGRAGALLGCAAAFKVLPVLLVLVFLARRSRRALLASAASLGAWLLLPALVLGWRGNLDSLALWWRAVPLPHLQGGRALLEQNTYLPGQSLTAVAYRLLSATPATARGTEGPTAELVDLDPDTVVWIVRALQASALALLCATLLVSARRETPAARVHELALALCFALALGPLVHKAHMSWLLLAHAVLLSGPPPGLARIPRLARTLLIVLSIAFIGLTPPAIVGRAFATRALMLNSIFLGLVAVTTALLIDVWCVATEVLPAKGRSSS